MGKKISEIIFLITFLGFPGIINFSSNSKVTGMLINNELQISDSWNLPFVIVIDNNWSDTRDTYDWCYGLGTEQQPYVIENVIINGQDTKACITVKNTNVFFKIQNCIVYNGTYGIELFNVVNGTITQCNITDNNEYGIYMKQGSYNIFQNNNFSNNCYYGICCRYNSDFNQILNNTFIDDSILYRCGTGYFTYNSTVKGNIIYNGVINFPDFIEGFIIEDNYIQNGNIETDGTVLTKIENNTIKFGDGIYLGYSAVDCHIANNTLIHNNVGITITYSQNQRYNYISDNKLINNSLGMDIGDGNFVINNIVIGSEMSIKMLGNSTAYLNRFEHNGTYSNARGGLSDTKWDNGSIGNYWGDYGGVDANDDGIGDTPYNITSQYAAPDNQDHYPIWYTEPTISISSPLNNTYWNSEPLINVNVYDGTLQYTWYNVSNDREFLESNVAETLRSDMWNKLPQGPFLIEFYANDSIANINDHYKHILIKDTIPPSLTIESPLNNTIFEDSYPTLNVTASDINLDSIWYIFNNLSKRYYFNGSEQVAQSVWNSLPDGNVIITVGVDDKAGNTISKEIVVIKKTVTVPKPGPNSLVVISFLISFLLIGVFSVSIIFVKLHKRRTGL